MISKIKLDFYSHTKSYIEFRNILVIAGMKK